MISDPSTVNTKSRDRDYATERVKVPPHSIEAEQSVIRWIDA